MAAPGESSARDARSLVVGVRSTGPLKRCSRTIAKYCDLAGRTGRGRDALERSNFRAPMLVTSLRRVRPGKQAPPVLAGGGGAKVSEAYEAMWNASALLDLVAGLAVRMRSEVPGTAGFGFEFWLDRLDRREWHQVKYQRGASGRWSLAALDSENVLERFRDKLQADPAEPAGLSHRTRPVRWTSSARAPAMHVASTSSTATTWGTHQLAADPVSRRVEVEHTASIRTCVRASNGRLRSARRTWAAGFRPRR
jgi:hypothetical protein